MALKMNTMDIDKQGMEAEYEPRETRPQRRAQPRRVWARIVPWIIAIAALAAFGYYFWQYRTLAANDPSVAAHAAAEKAVRELSAVMIVPDDPNPVVATVSDKTKLAGQPFFADAENGDEVIIFPSAGKAVLYRPSVRKVIDIAPLSGSGPSVTNDSSSN